MVLKKFLEKCLFVIIAKKKVTWSKIVKKHRADAATKKDTEKKNVLLLNARIVKDSDMKRKLAGNANAAEKEVIVSIHVGHPFAKTVKKLGIQQTIASEGCNVPCV